MGARSLKSFKKYLNAKTLTIDQLAKKHNVSKKHVLSQLKKGIKIEKEHTKRPDIAKEIASDHIGEDPKYYDKLEKIENK